MISESISLTRLHWIQPSAASTTIMSLEDTNVINQQVGKYCRDHILLLISMSHSAHDIECLLSWKQITLSRLPATRPVNLVYGALTALLAATLNVHFCSREGSLKNQIRQGIESSGIPGEYRSCG